MKAKATFLLVIFLLNHLVGFACAFDNEIKALQKNEAAHVHSSHNHHASPHKHDDHGHGDNNGHASPLEEAALQDTEDSSNGANNCCKDDVSKFDSLSKVSSRSGKIIIDTPVADLVPNRFSPFVSTVQSKGFVKYFPNRQRPPNTDIRILIQSFQI